VITDGATFSAGIYTSFYPKSADAERTVVVGETVGDHARFWAETGPALTLPDTGYRIAYSLRMHDVAEGCADRKICHMTRGFDPRWNLAVGSIGPDWPVETRFADFVARRDPALERILADAARPH
jgi:hypothetical protein